jgi:hypothetical protein
MKKIINLLIIHILSQTMIKSQETFFFVEADNVNIRELPSTKSKSLGKIPKRTLVSWRDSVETSNEIINWNGKPTKGKWYKISTSLKDENEGYKHIEGWIFEKSFNFSERIRYYEFFKLDFSKTIDNEQVKIENATKSEFDKLKSSFITIPNTKKFQKDSILALPLANGEKYYIHENVKTDSDDWLKISFCGEIKALDLYTVGLGFYESSIFQFIKKSNGLVIGIDEFGELQWEDERKNVKLIHSPDFRFFVLGRGDGYESSGICFVDLKNNTSIAIGSNEPKDFRWIDNKSGIAYLEESDYQGGTKKSYIKFTLK